MFSTLWALARLPRLLQRGALVGLVIATTAACGDAAGVPAVCDEALCIDCNDSCCYDLGYC